MLKCNWKQATRLLSSLLLVFLMGCAQDNALTEPKVVSENGDLGFRAEDPDPEVDCKCYMSMRNIVNAEPGVLWGFNDFTNKPTPPVYQQQGSGNTWESPITSMNFVPFPSPFEELNPPSNGWHTFSFYYGGNLENDPVMNTIVRCFLQNPDGSETLATTTYHSFRFSDGVPSGDPATPLFTKQFSCLVLTNPGSPEPN